MFAKLKAAWSRLAGGGAAGGGEGPAVPPVEYKGFRIKPAPFRNNGNYQTAGTIEKEVDGVRKEHRFIRADSHPIYDDAVTFTVAKARQIIDQLGSRLFD